MSFRTRPTGLAISPQRYELTTAAAADPLTLDDAKEYALIEDDDRDGVVRRLLKANTTRLEKLVGRRFINTTLTAYFDAFPASIDDWLELRVLPVSSISSIKYIATDGTETTWSSANYLVDNKSDNLPVRIQPVHSEAWPTPRQESNAVRVEFVAGYGAAHTNVPDDVKFTLALMISHDFTNRDLGGRTSDRLQDMIDGLRWDGV